MVAILSALGFLAAGAAALLVERERIIGSIERSLAQEIAEFTELFGEGIDPETGRPFDSADRILELSMQRNVPDEHETQIGILSDVTIVLGNRSGSLQRDGAFREAVTSFDQPGYGHYHNEDLGRVMFAVMPLEIDGVRSHFVSVSYADAELAELDDAIRSFALAAVVSWAVLVVAAGLLAHRILRPVNDLRRTAATITDSDVSQRIDVRGKDEMAELGRTFNVMLDRLEAALGSQRRMLDDAAHELRTPITVIRGHLELMDQRSPDEVDETRELAIDELDRMGRLVEDLLVLAKSRRPDFLVRRPTDLGDLVTRSVDKAQALAPRTWSVEATPGLTAYVDPQRITQALLQLASNAVAVTGMGDAIAMGCTPVSQGVQLWVRDTGPGVPEEDRERIFTRWQTGDTALKASGTGLGLAIVTAIAEAHGGTAFVESAGPSGGALFVIEVPHADRGYLSETAELATHIPDRAAPVPHPPYAGHDHSDPR